MGFSIVVSVGPWGGLYLYRGWSKRICLGWFAITFYPRDMDDILQMIRTDEAEAIIQDDIYDEPIHYHDIEQMW